MRTIGLLGGMSWESTLHYYRLFNEETKARLGGLHSAPLLLRSLDFEPVARLQAEGRWHEAGALLADMASGLERAGAELLVLCTNTMHLVAPAIEQRLTIPFVHIVDPVGAEANARGLRRVGLLATRFTMEEPFYRERLAERFGVEVVTPPPLARAEVHRIIFEELCLGQIREPSRLALRTVAADLLKAGAEAIVLGCTELNLLLGPADVDAPVFDSVALHVRAAIERALE